MKCTKCGGIMLRVIRGTTVFKFCENYDGDSSHDAHTENPVKSTAER